ncbi:MAG: tetratricopeptide repeat protein, partial [Candidatus Hinthialibacter sp.]
MNPPKDRKSILDLSLQWGVRSGVILQAMRDVGLSAEEHAEIDDDEESMILDRMIENGAIPSRPPKRKKTRKLGEQAAVPDELFMEALGASENGFSDACIPRQVVFEQNLKKKSLFQKWFGPKNELASSLKEKNLTPDAVESMFISADDILEQSSPPPRPEHPPAPPEAEFPTPGPPESHPPLEEDAALDAHADPELSTLDQEEIELDGDFLENMEGFDEIELDDDSNLNVDDVEELEDFDFEDEPLDEIQSEVDSEDDAQEFLEEDDLDELSPDSEEEEEEEQQKQQIPKTKLHKIHAEDFASYYLERLLARFRLSPAEMWALMIGAVVVMLAILGATLYWWMFASPRALESLLAEADSIYVRAIEIETPEWRRGRIVWKKPRDSFAEAASLYEDYLKRSPKDHQALQSAFKNMCDCYYRIAAGDKQEGDQEKSSDAFRQMAALYNNYLDLIEKVAGGNIGDPQDPQLAYPELEDQRLALFRIALAKRELEQYDQAIELLQDFIRRFPQTDQALDAMIEIGNSYQEWSKSNKEQEHALLAEAVNAYKNALDAIPPSD